jgi:hypothetical protein
LNALYARWCAPGTIGCWARTILRGFAAILCENRKTFGEDDLLLGRAGAERYFEDFKKISLPSA